MLPLPSMKLCALYPFTLLVTEEVTGYLLKFADLAELLLRSQSQRILKMFLDREPSDQRVKEIWVEEQEGVQWQAYRKKCVKEARKVLKTERAVSRGEWAIRKPGLPKAIKDHRPFTPRKQKDNPTSCAVFQGSGSPPRLP
jgi:hypothetical protein